MQLHRHHACGAEYNRSVQVSDVHGGAPDSTPNSSPNAPAKGTQFISPPCMIQTDGLSICSGQLLKTSNKQRWPLKQPRQHHSAPLHCTLLITTPPAGLQAQVSALLTACPYQSCNQSVHAIKTTDARPIASTPSWHNDSLRNRAVVSYSLHGDRAKGTNTSTREHWFPTVGRLTALKKEQSSPALASKHSANEVPHLRSIAPAAA